MFHNPTVNLVLPFVLIYFIVIVVAETVIQITDHRSKVEDETGLNICIAFWPVTLALGSAGIVIYGLVLALKYPVTLYKKYIIEPLRTKYKRYVWEKKNKKALEEEQKKQRRA